VLLLPENRNTATDSDPEALIEEARQLQRQRTRRRNIQLQITAVLVILGVEIGQLVRGGSSAPPTPQQPQPGAAHVPVVKYEKIVVKKIVPHLPVEVRTVELWSSSASPGIQRAVVTIQGGRRFEVGTAIRRDKLLGLVKVAYFYDAPTDTIYQAGYLRTAPDSSPGFLTIPAPVGTGGESAIPAPAGKQPTRRLFNTLRRDPDWRLHGPRTYRGRSVYVLVHQSQTSPVKQTLYFDATTSEVIRNEIAADDVRNVENTVARTTLPATKAILALTSLQAAHPRAHIALHPSLRIRQLSGDAFYLSGAHDG
jgi:hypothetical protein